MPQQNYQTLPSMTNPKALTPGDKVRLLDLEDLELQLELEARKREVEAEKPSEVIGIDERHKAFIAAYPLKDYIFDGWHILEEGRKFESGWHIDIICELLQATVIRDVRNAIINIPRRCMKSLLICVFFPTWTWTFLPISRFLYTSYTEKYAKRDNVKCQRLINSNWYKKRFGHLFSLVTETKENLTNTRGGFRQVFKIGGGTGEGGDFTFADDPNNIAEVESETVLDRTNHNWTEITYHNVANKLTAVRLVIQQRTGVNDLTGFLLDDPELSKQYQKLILPMKYESDHPTATTPKNPLYLGKVSEHEAIKNPNLKVGESKMWVDPRDLTAKDFDNLWYQEWYKNSFLDKGYESKGDGQLLWENYMTEEVVEDDIQHLKAYGEASQFQQRPYRRGGQFFNSENFETVSYTELPLHTGMVFCRYWDKASTEGGGDWTVGMLLARTMKRPFTFYIVDIIRKQIGYHERMKLIVDTARQDTVDYIDQYIYNEYSVGLEREPASSGKDLATIEVDALAGYEVFIDKVAKKKSIRAKPVRSFSESGRIKVVKAPWNTVFFKRLEKFDPLKENNKDDEIDTLSGSFRKLCFGISSSTGTQSGIY